MGEPKEKEELENLTVAVLRHFLNDPERCPPSTKIDIDYIMKNVKKARRLAKYMLANP